MAPRRTPACTVALCSSRAGLESSDIEQALNDKKLLQACLINADKKISQPLSGRSLFKRRKPVVDDLLQCTVRLDSPVHFFVVAAVTFVSH
jgi:hypothetical protein